MIHEGKIYIGQIPCLKITTDEDLKGIVIFLSRLDVDERAAILAGTHPCSLWL